MSENRRVTRRNDEFRIGMLQLDGMGAAIDCLIWDLSPGGACVEVAVQETIDRFLLSTGDGSDLRQCTVVRREGIKLGVRFD